MADWFRSPPCWYHLTCTVWAVILVSASWFLSAKISLGGTKYCLNSSSSLRQIYLEGLLIQIVLGKNVSSLSSLSYQSDNPPLIAQGDLNTHTLALTHGYKGHTIAAVTHAVLRHGSVNTHFHILHCLQPTPQAQAASTNHLHMRMTFHSFISVVILDQRWL